MVVLISTARALPPTYGYLNVPRQGVWRREGIWACDNGAFTGFDAVAFERMLSRCRPQAAAALFVAVPDVVGDWVRTRRLWTTWSPVVRAYGFRPALVLQDGVEPRQIPWSQCGAVFVGGSTGFKLGTLARSIVGYARACGKWVHMGRVNSGRRYQYAASIGVQSIDGTAFSMFYDEFTRRLDRWRAADVSAVPLQRELF
jgi:hypothetical protein